jgi:hydroxyacylglutathione hydrolase
MAMEIKCINLGMSNCYLVKNEEKYFLIDSGPVTKRSVLENELQRAGCTPQTLVLILLTHADSDHSGNAAFLRSKYGTKIGMHAAEVIASEHGDMFLTRSHLNVFSKLVGKLILILLGVNHLDRFTPDLLLEDDMSLLPYGWDARVVHIPGHSCGSIGILSAEGAFFGGDLLTYEKGRLRSLIDDRQAHQNSLEKVKKLSIHTFYPGHGQPFDKNVLLQSGL